MTSEIVKKGTPALYDDAIKGLMRSVGDAGATPSNLGGRTLLALGTLIYDWIYSLERRLALPGDAELYTTTPLGAGAVYNGQTKDFFLTRLGFMGCLAFADQPSATDGFMIQQSVNGANWDLDTAKTSVAANVGAGIKAGVVTRYVRVRYVNGPTAQTVFRLGGRYAIA